MTVQTTILKLALRIDPRTKQGQLFTDSGSTVTITGATNATPIVITTAVAHGRVNGDQVYVTGVLGNTAANNTAAARNWYVSVQSATTLALYQDSTLSTGVAGNGAYTSGGSLTGALIGSVDGDRFTSQRLLDIYNDARLALVGILSGPFAKYRRSIRFSGAILRITNFQFTAGVANKPTGYLDTIYLQDSTGANIPVIAIELLPLVAEKESSGNRFVFEVGTTLQTNSGNTYIPDASTYKLGYYSLTSFTLAQVLDGTTTETFDDDLQPILLELAEAIANEMGGHELNRLGSTLLQQIPQQAETGIN